jgi:hypothetical protein
MATASGDAPRAALVSRIIETPVLVMVKTREAPNDHTSIRPKKPSGASSRSTRVDPEVSIMASRNAPRRSPLSSLAESNTTVTIVTACGELVARQSLGARC